MRETCLRRPRLGHVHAHVVQRQRGDRLRTTRPLVAPRAVTQAPTPDDGHCCVPSHPPGYITRTAPRISCFRGRHRDTGSAEERWLRRGRRRWWPRSWGCTRASRSPGRRQRRARRPGAIGVGLVQPHRGEPAADARVLRDAGHRGAGRERGQAAALLGEPASALDAGHQRRQRAARQRARPGRFLAGADRVRRHRPQARAAEDPGSGSHHPRRLRA